MELVLDRKLADRRVYPALDISQSGTRKEERLLPPEVLQRVTHAAADARRYGPGAGDGIARQEARAAREQRGVPPAHRGSLTLNDSPPAPPQLQRPQRPRRGRELAERQVQTQRPGLEYHRLQRVVLAGGVQGRVQVGDAERVPPRAPPVAGRGAGRRCCTRSGSRPAATAPGRSGSYTCDTPLSARRSWTRRGVTSSTATRCRSATTRLNRVARFMRWSTSRASVTVEHVSRMRRKHMA